MRQLNDGRVETTLPSKTRNEEWTDLIRTVQVENLLFLDEQNSRKEVVRESRHFRAAVIKRKRTTRKNPRLRRRLSIRAA